MGVWKDLSSRGHKWFVNISSTPTVVASIDPTTGNFTGRGVPSNVVIAKSADYTITDTDGYGTIVASGNGTDITLPNPVTNSGRTITIQRNDASYLITVKRYSSENFIWQNNNLPYDLTLNNGDIIQVQSNGTNWIVLNYTGLGQDNFVINGGFDFWQRGVGPFTTSAYHADRFRADFTLGTQTITKTTSTVSKNGNALRVVTTGAGSPTASQYSMAQHYLEGTTASQVYGKVITFSFWVQSSVVGTFGFAIRNFGATRSYVTNVTINAINTWEYKTVSLYMDR